MTKTGRLYFYTERGVTKTYIYCTLCGSGPYKEHDPELHRSGEHTYHCRICLRDLGIKAREPEPEPVIDEEQEPDEGILPT